MGARSHTFVISSGVELKGSKALVTIFEGSRFSDTTILEIAREALKAGPDTALREWVSPRIRHDAERYPGANPLEGTYYTCEVLFSEVTKLGEQ